MDSNQLSGQYDLAKLLGYQGGAEQFKSEYRKYYDEFMATIDNKPDKVESIPNPFH